MSSFKNHFSDGGADYAVYRPTYPAVLVDYLAGLTPRRELAWESGCGSGQLTLLLAERFERVIATDGSADQLAHASAHSKVEYHCAAAEASGLPDGVADLAVSAQAAHWFDLPAYYAEVRRVTRPGGIVAMVTYGLTVIDEKIDAVVSHFYANVAGPYWPPERSHVEQGYRSLSFPFEELEAPALEMRAEWPLAGLVGYIETWSAVRAMAKAEGRAKIDAFRRELAKAWGPEAMVRTIRWPLSLRVGRV